MFEKFDGVLIDGKHPGTVEQPGAGRSLVRTSTDEPGVASQDWYGNERLTLTHRRREKAHGDEVGVTLY